jgi:muramoyltetrapeptide carboxypeptidase
METLHAVMPVNITGENDAGENLQTLMNALFGKRLTYSYAVGGPARTGAAEGVLTGGNLSILYSLMGSVSLPDTAGRILFLEDVDEYLYHIDRMMVALKRAGTLDRLKGLIIGGMSKMNDNAVPFGKTAEEIIADHVKEYAYPVCYHFPAGHQELNLALILGRKVNLTVGSQVELAFY